MWTEQQYETAAALAERERLDALERHRARMASETPSPDGLCEECGDEIPARRLEALPNARTCVPCQEVRDQQQQRYARS
ncbi:TraR/DksA C4-type zinc finger protein [Halomonas sp. E14]|uniref:TraR/DksA C4-type zinc finger protein n=1 Tax=Halomonas sp. E14 TaxID=3397245 RepID=UPI00403EAD81